MCVYSGFMGESDCLFSFSQVQPTSALSTNVYHQGAAPVVNDSNVAVPVLLQTASGVVVPLSNAITPSTATPAPHANSDKKHQCPVCFKAFKRKHDRYRHMNVHYKKGHIEGGHDMRAMVPSDVDQSVGMCVMCGLSYRSESRLRAHCIKSHGNANLITKNSTTSMSGTPHTIDNQSVGGASDITTVATVDQSVLNTLQLTAPQCKEQLSSSEMSHITETTPTSLATPTSPSCKLPVTALSDSYLKRPQQCPHCTLRCGSRNALTEHIRTHTGERPYHCIEPGCSKAFARNRELVLHQRVHARRKAQLSETNTPETKTTDQVMSAVGNIAQIRGQNVTIVEENTGNVVNVIQSADGTATIPIQTLSFQCIKCDQTFTDNVKYVQHYYETHEAQQYSVVSVDGVTMAAQSHLQQNVQTIQVQQQATPIRTVPANQATVVNKQPCEQLGNVPPNGEAINITPRGLSVGVLSDRHTPKHTCDHCGKVCRNSFSLVEHVRTHTAEKPFQCTFCLRPFARERDVRYHLPRCKEKSN